LRRWRNSANAMLSKGIVLTDLWVRVPPAALPCAPMPSTPKSLSVRQGAERLPGSPRERYPSQHGARLAPRSYSATANRLPESLPQLWSTGARLRGLPAGELFLSLRHVSRRWRYLQVRSHMALENLARHEVARHHRVMRGRDANSVPRESGCLLATRPAGPMHDGERLFKADPVLLSPTWGRTQAPSPDRADGLAGEACPGAP
jgi:hypothetical protein